MEGVEVPVIEGELVRLWVLQWRKEGQRKAGRISRCSLWKGREHIQVGLWKGSPMSSGGFGV